jgi:cytochrome c biogenesis protein CcmG/thiol:disulfide interchange protein DsbE
LPSTPSSAPPDAGVRSDPPAEAAPRGTRIILLAIAVVVVLGVGVLTWLAVRDENEPTGAAGTPRPAPGLVRAGDPAPDFELPTLDGDTVRLADFRGTPVVLNFWASYCHPCRAEFPLLRTADAEADGDYVVVGVDTQDIRSDAVAFAKEERATWVNGFDPEGAVAAQYGARGLPYTFFIDGDGTVTGVVVAELGADQLTEELARFTS